jgi:hypothetical protein
MYYSSTDFGGSFRLKAKSRNFYIIMSTKPTFLNFDLREGAAARQAPFEWVPAMTNDM